MPVLPPKSPLQPWFPTKDGAAYKPTKTRFAGYHWVDNASQHAKLNKPSIWKAGTQGQDAMLLEMFLPGVGKRAVEMKKSADNRYWVAPNNATDGLQGDTLYYRFWNENDDINFDLTERREYGDTTADKPSGKWNVARKQNGPIRTGSTLYAYLDSMVLPNANSNDPLTDPLSMPAPTDSETRYRGNIQGVNTLLNRLNTTKTRGVGAVMLTPHSGDWESAHHYWTADPFALNDAFPEPDDFDNFFLNSLTKGVKVYCDGAFVNQGFASPLYQDLLLNGVRSPYWRWFVFDKGDPKAKERLYPNTAVHQKMVVGALPVKDNAHGSLTIDWPKVGFKIINSPYSANYNKSQPVYLQQFDPTAPTDPNAPRPWVPGGRATHPFRWPVKASELKARLAHSSLPKSTTVIASDQAANFLEWNNFRLGRPDEDDSGYKWDGKVQAVQMNMDNPHVQEYTAKALAYWTQRVQNLYRLHLASDLQYEFDKSRNWKTALEQVNQNIANGDLNLAQPGLPTNTLAQLKRDIADTPLPVGKTLLDTLLTNVPPISVELPSDALRLKALLSHPDIMDYLLHSKGNRQVAASLLGPAQKMLGTDGAVGKGLSNWVNKDNVYTQLSNAMDSIAEQLSPQAKQVLKHPLGQQLFASIIGPSVWQLVFTGQPESDPNTVRQQLYNKLGPSVLMQDPNSSKHHLRNAMLGHITALPVTQLAQHASDTLGNITPESIVIAEYMAQQGELGLNWRLDAAKDVADIDLVRNAPDTPAQKRMFKKQMYKATVLWGKLLAKTKAIFPKTSIIAELTEMTPLGGVEGGKKALDNLLTPQANGQSSLFGGPVNMDYFFSTLLRLIHHDPKPYEFGQTQMQVENTDNPNHSFWSAALKPLVYGHAKAAVQQTQTFTASHDYSNTLYNLLRHPVIHSMDYYPYRGLDQDVRDVLTAIASKPDFATLRQEMSNAGMMDPQEALENLADLAQNLELSELPETLHDFYREEDKKAAMEQYKLSEPPRNMSFLRQAFGKTLLNIATTDRSDYADDWKAALRHPVLGGMIKAQLNAAFATPSEVWATRALLVNGYQHYTQKSGLAHLPQPKAFYDALADTLNTWGQHHPRLPGYMSLAKLVDEIGSRLYPKDPKGRIAAAFKHDFFQHMLSPALEKDRRRMALMVALPGQPSWYDVFRTGGERTNNEFMQNREPVRLDWLDNPQMNFIKKEFDFIRNVLALRQQYPVINGGFLQNITQDDANGVLITAWDGGPQQSNSSLPAANGAGQQVIMMVNTGKPAPVEGEHYNFMLGGSEESYPDITATQPILENYEPDLFSLAQPQGTVYTNPANGDEYTVDDNGHLKLTKGKGLLKTYVALVRQAPTPAKAPANKPSVKVDNA